MKNSIKIYLAFFVLMYGCKEPYQPTLTTANLNALVVEGLINTGTDSTFIKLSRTVVIAQKNTALAEGGATLSIEGEANETYALKEKEKGTYVAPPLNLNPNKKYRLRIKTTKGAVYVSDFVETKLSPPIDSVTWAVKTDGVQLYVNAHDVSNKTRYYRWEYTDTWVFFAKFNSHLFWSKDSLKGRESPRDDIYKCWTNGSSSTIVLGSSVKLSQDVIAQNPLAFIPSTSEKLEEKYSILVKQYALTKEAFEFWQNLKKNTENLGSIFDVQPSQLTGNIHNIADASEPVIGYISAGSYQQQRIFIPRNNLPPWRATYPYDCVIPDTVVLADVKGLFSSDPINNIPISEVTNTSGIVYGYTWAPRVCVDCTVRGTNKKPAFWQ